MFAKGRNAKTKLHYLDRVTILIKFRPRKKSNIALDQQTNVSLGLKIKTKLKDSKKI